MPSQGAQSLSTGDGSHTGVYAEECSDLRFSCDWLTFIECHSGPALLLHCSNHLIAQSPESSSNPGRCCNYPHFMGEETGVRGGKVTCSHSWISKPGRHPVTLTLWGPSGGSVRWPDVFREERMGTGKLLGAQESHSNS